MIHKHHPLSALRWQNLFLFSHYIDRNRRKQHNSTMKKTCKMETFLPSLLSFYILSKPLRGFSQNLSRDQYLWPVKQIKTSFTQASRIISLVTTAERRKHFGLTTSFFLLQNSLRLKVGKNISTVIFEAFRPYCVGFPPLPPPRVWIRSPKPRAQWFVQIWQGLYKESLQAVLSKLAPTILPSRKRDRTLLSSFYLHRFWETYA